MEKKLTAEELVARSPKLFGESFWKRSLAVFGYNFVGGLIIYGVILGVAAIAGLIGFILRGIF